MAIDEELLRPSREHLAYLRGKIAALEDETRQKIDWYPDDKERARELWRQFSMSVEPVQREIDAVETVITDYYGAQTMPPVIVAVLHN